MCGQKVLILIKRFIGILYYVILFYSNDISQNNYHKKQSYYNNIVITSSMSIKVISATVIFLTIVKLTTRFYNNCYIVRHASILHTPDS